MELLLIAAACGLVGIAGWALWRSCACLLWCHPRDERRMRPGRRDAKGRVVTAWECGRCARTIAIVREPVNASLLRALRQQVGASRARAKGIELRVVRTTDEERSA